MPLWILIIWPDSMKSINRAWAIHDHDGKEMRKTLRNAGLGTKPPSLPDGLYRP